MTATPQRSAEWFAARVGRVTGSIVGAILGLSPYMTRADAMRAMVRARDGLPTEFTGNVATEWGTHHEAGARWEYEMETGRTVADAGFVTREDWLGASPDGYVGDDGLIEIKCPYGLRSDEPPVAFKPLSEQPHYYAQIQVQLHCTERAWCDFYQWTPHATKLERVDIDVAWLNIHLPQLRQFWAEYLDEPSDDHANPKRALVDTPDALRLLNEYDELSDAIAAATERRGEVLTALVKAAGERDALICNRKLTLVQKAGTVSYAKAVKALAPDADLSPYTGKPSSHRKLT